MFLLILLNPYLLNTYLLNLMHFITYYSSVTNSHNSIEALLKEIENLKNLLNSKVNVTDFFNLKEFVSN